VEFFFKLYWPVTVCCFIDRWPSSSNRCIVLCDATFLFTSIFFSSFLGWLFFALVFLLLRSFQTQRTRTANLCVWRPCCDQCANSGVMKSNSSSATTTGTSSLIRLNRQRAKAAIIKPKSLKATS
jgi:hypothetical protein